MRPWSPQEKFCECKKSLSSIAFDEAVKVPRISQPLSVWPFSTLLYWYVWTHPRSLSLNDSQEQKTLLSCPPFYVFFPFCFSPSVPFLFYSNWDWSRHKQPISETSSTTVSPCRSQGIPAKFAAFSASPSFWVRKKGCKLTSWGVLLCWLPETDTLQEFWKQIRLTLLSGPWLLFSPMC